MLTKMPLCFCSPASGPCSTDSPGSSVSIDEADGEGWGSYGHSLTRDEPVILEENCSDDISWPGSASLLLPVRKFSPSQVHTSISAGSPSQVRHVQAKENVWSWVRRNNEVKQL
jgi:hypothetical protein